MASAVVAYTGTSTVTVETSFTVTSPWRLPRMSYARVPSTSDDRSADGHSRVPARPSHPAAAARPHARQLRCPPRWQPVLSPRSFAEHVAAK